MFDNEDNCIYRNGNASLFLMDNGKLSKETFEKAEDAERSANILQMVVGMAQKLHMPVIAEGVETKEQADYLDSIGCDIVQGYFYAKPMPIEEFEKLLGQYSYKEIMERV